MVKLRQSARLKDQRVRSQDVTHKLPQPSINHVVVALILVLAFGLRVAVYIEAPRPLDGAGLVAEQGEMARNIVDHGVWFSENPAAYALLKKRQAQEQRLVDPAGVDFSEVDRRSSPIPIVNQMPGVAVILAGLWWSTGNQTYALLQWLQLLLDTVMVLVVYWIALRLSNSLRVSAIAAFLYAIWPGAIVVAKRPMLDTWAGFFTIACAALFVWARERPSSRSRLAILGFVTGLGIYFRPFIILVPILLALVATPGRSWRRRIMWVACPTAIALLVLAPWTIRNYQEFHRFIPTRTGLGQALFEGTGQTASDEGAAEFVRSHGKNAAYGSPAYDDFLLSGAARAIFDDPGFYLRLVGHRARLLLPCLLALLAWRRWRSAVLIPVTAAAAVILPYLLIGDDTRLYLPAAFAYLILIAMVVELALSATGQWRTTIARLGFAPPRRRLRTSEPKDKS
jgi:hypothetical protein